MNRGFKVLATGLAGIAGGVYVYEEYVLPPKDMVVRTVSAQKNTDASLLQPSPPKSVSVSNDAILVEIVEGNIVEEKVDCIVNAANEHLMHGGGIAGAIVQAGGATKQCYINQELDSVSQMTVEQLLAKNYLNCKTVSTIQKQSDEYIFKNGPLEVGGVAVTECGDMPCEYIIHAVGPRYPRTPVVRWGGSWNKTGTVKNVQNSESVVADQQNIKQRAQIQQKRAESNQQKKAAMDLKTTVTNCLAKADSMGVESISIPAISTGIFGFPKKKGIPIIYNAVKEYCNTQKRTNLNNIRLVVNDPQSFKLYEQEISDFSTEKQSEQLI